MRCGDPDSGGDPAPPGAWRPRGGGPCVDHNKRSNIESITFDAKNWHTPDGAWRPQIARELDDEHGHVHVWDVDMGDVATCGHHDATDQHGKRHGGRCDGHERRARA